MSDVLESVKILIGSLTSRLDMMDASIAQLGKKHEALAGRFDASKPAEGDNKGMTAEDIARLSNAIKMSGIAGKGK